MESWGASILIIMHLSSIEGATFHPFQFDLQASDLFVELPRWCLDAVGIGRPVVKDLGAVFQQPTFPFGDLIGIDLMHGA